VLAETAFEYFPAPQVAHESGVEDDGAAFPIGHAVHEADIAGEEVPGGHGEHNVEEVERVE